jgi:tyrosyl-tRNA synthetase
MMKKKNKKLLKGFKRIIGKKSITDKFFKKKRLKIKFGIDPTAHYITFGHVSILDKLREFQILNHKIMIIIGDFTAKIGDPTGKIKSRKELNSNKIKYNSKKLLDQIFQIISKKKTKVFFNSTWFDKMKVNEMFNILKKISISKILNRKDFIKRYASNHQILTSEILYPILQGYDSVKVNADIEIGGDDQLLNMLIGRYLQKSFSFKKQTILTLPLLTGMDGNKKMSKSNNNFISLLDSSREMFGKIMSIKDELIPNFFKISLKNYDEKKIMKMKPFLLKKKIANDIISRFFDRNQSKKEQKYFNSVYCKKQIPTKKIDKVFIWEKLSNNKEEIIIDLIYNTKILKSKREILRVWKQGGIKIFGIKNQGNNFYIKRKIKKPKKNQEIIFKIGKKIFFKIIY